MNVERLQSAWELMAELQHHYSQGCDSYDNLADVRQLLESEARRLGGRPEDWRDRSPPDMPPLHAAAPQLLEACLALLARIESDIESPDRRVAEADLARAAIAAARG